MIGPDEWWLGPNLIVAMAAVFGVAVAGTARWLSAHRLAIALSGLAGPSVVAAAYLVVGPAGDLMSSYVAALLAATVGLLTSAATAAAHRGTGDAATTARTPAALTAGASATAPRDVRWRSSPARAAHHPAARNPAAESGGPDAAAQTRRHTAPSPGGRSLRVRGTLGRARAVSTACRPPPRGPR